MKTHASLRLRFENLEIPAPDFHHEDHVKVAFEMLEAYDFLEASTRYATTIRTMACRVGVPEKFNVTITLAFMSLVAERKSLCPAADLDTFLAKNNDLLDKHVLRRWYSDERLTSAKARRLFLLPDAGNRAA
ncbi:MAG: hypothetical protein AAGA41_00260 [Pseudomonadota bacterium]